ncbi:tape measure protein [Hymenobacter sp. HMF4947]|uniref:Tape measure protein n=1 Tax=Hymenobacter ginkgonis TaxID=2682976 RepID=A0A7K1TKH2_9BACT|nr:tape measure protein [Hymenobacter ginkgonis]MVN78918.1 tape measure protein [Hymenobacter ginkgonis]
MSDILASVSVVLGAEISGFKAAMADARKELKGLVQFSEGLKDIGTSLTTYVSAPLALLGTASVVASAKLESLKNGLQAIAQQELGKQGVTGLGAVGIAAQQTSERIKELQVIAKAPGLGLETAEQADIRLRAVGTSAQESAKEIKAFANAIATTGGGRTEFQTVTTQLAQMTAKGKVLAQDLRPIIEAAPAVAAALQTLYGTVDSEDISKALAKQGQSSEDFVAILTEELGKLPQVTGGLKAIYENDLDALLVSSAKIGDGIAKAFNLQDVGQKLGEEISAIGDAFAGLPEGVQQAIVVFAGLVAATGPVLVGLGTLGVALPAIKAGFASISSLVPVLSAGLSALVSPIGLVVVGLAALAAGAYYVATANERALDSYKAQAQETDNLVGTINPLLARYNELSAKTVLTTNEQTELTSIIKQLAAAVPGATTAIDEYGNATAISTGAVTEFTQALQAQKAAQAALNLPAASEKLEELGTKYKVLKRQADEFNKTGSIKVATFDSGGGALETFGAGSKAVLELQANLATANVEFLKQKQLVDELKGATNGLAEADDSLAGALMSVGLAGGRTSGILADLREQLKKVQEQRETETTVGAIKVDNAQILSLQKQIAELEGTGKKGADAIAKLRLELSRLTALDRLLGDLPNQLEVTERRVDALQKGLKTLVDAGVGTSSRAFQGFAVELANLSRQLDKVKGSGGTLEFKPASVKTLLPTTIGDTLPQDVARLLGDYAKQAKPFELPLAVKLNMKAILDAPKPFQILKTELENLGKGFREVDGAAQLGINFDVAGSKANILQNTIQNLLAQGFSPLDTGLQQLSAQFKQLVVDSQATQVVKAGVMDLAAGISTAFSDALSGTQSIGDSLLQTLLSTVGTIASELGGILLASGLGIEALKVSLANFTGVGAIAAGLGLLAIGGIAKGAAANLGKSAGSSASSSPTTSNYGQTSTQQTIKVIAEFRLRGQDLVAVGRSQTFRSKVTD